MIALTGGSGFIGKRFAALARSRGYRIRQLTRRPASDFPDDEVCPFDLETPTTLEPCATLVHLAAHIPADHHNPAEAARCLNINALGTLRLLQNGFDHIVQTTSANAYAPAVNPDETAAMFPASRGYYLGSKILQEIYAAEYCRANNYRLTTLRLASVYGPGQTSGALSAMLKAKKISISDAGRFGSDMVHVDDVARALLLVIDRQFAGPLNVGSGVRTTIATLADMVAERTGAQVIHDDHDGGDDGFPALDITRLLSLGHHPTPLQSGLDAL